MCLSPDLARLPPRRRRQQQTVSPLSLWPSAIPSAQGSSKASPDRVETSPDCRTLQLTYKLLREIAPTASVVAVVLNPGTPYTALAYKELEAAANVAKVQLRAFEVRSPEEIAPQLKATKAAGAGGLVVLEDPLTFTLRSEIAAFASRLRLPAVYGYREFAEAGGLMSYGTNHDTHWRRGAEIVDLILKGAKPADIPVEQPTKFELVVNLMTAKALDLPVPATIMIRADKVIE